MIPSEVKEWLLENKFGTVASQKAVGGGCINNGMILQTESSRSFFLKVNPRAPRDVFEREAEGLQELNISGAPTIPEPFLYGSSFILMENLSPAPKKGSYWQDFGESLAVLHNHHKVQYGFRDDNYIGSTLQPNSWIEDGYIFFGQKRLLYMANLASSKGLLDRVSNGQVAKIVSRLRSLVPEQPASLIHGDLWSGNVISDSHGNPAMIDPAAYYGWAEADLAMTSLFGTFPSRFYHAYEEVRPLEPDYQRRFPIYNLYHLLNHVVLFGRSYLPQVKMILNKFA
jgi:fructosamine-3-kinase